LALNFFPADFDQTAATVWSGKYPGPEAVEELSKVHGGVVFWRDRDDGARLYAWHPERPLSGLPGFQEVTVTLEESPPLFQKLLSDAIRNRMQRIGFQEKSGGWVNYSRPSILASVPALASTVTGPIGIYPKLMIDVFFTRSCDEAILIGPVVDVLYTTRLDIPADEWVAAGMGDRLVGTYVTLVRATNPAHDRLVGKSIGRINGLRGERCVLTDLRDTSLAEVPLSDVAPEPTRTNLGMFLAARYHRAFSAGERALTTKLRELVRPRSRYELACALISKRLQNASDGVYRLQLLPGVTATMGPAARIGTPTFVSDKIGDPEYSFDRTGGKYARRVDDGLKRFGPYDQHLQRGAAPRLLVVAPAANKGDVEHAVQKVLNGVTTSENVFGGLKPMYRLRDLSVTYAFADVRPDAPMLGYAEAVNRALRDAASRGDGKPRVDMVLTVINDAYRRLPDSENPYFQAKALALVTEHVPTQAITIEKLRKADKDLQYVLNTMALACYAKLGGTSHVLKLPAMDADAVTELVFGIGRSVQRSTRFGDAQETIGFTTVFRANGEYVYNDCTPYSDASSYEQALEDTIRRTVSRVAAFEQLNDGAPLRLIFHVPRRPGRREEKAILNAVGKLPKYKIEFALVHVNDDHHLQLFDLDNSNPTSWGRPKPEAAFLPARGWSIAIGPRERLVTFVGPMQYRGNGSPTPLRITLDKRSTFKDVDYVTKQLYLLSFMSVRSLNPGILPATIIYAEQLAELTGHLRAVQAWTVDLVHQHLARKLWFI
jgi:hypothetical protein